MGGPVVKVAPRFGVMLGEGVVEAGGTGCGGGGKGVSGLKPLLVQFVEPVEGVAQNTQLVDPAALHRVLRQLGQLRLGRGQQVTGAMAQRLERGVGVGVAQACPPAVGVVVEGPAVEVSVLVGVGVPGVEDLLAVAQVAVEMAQEVAVCVVVVGDEEGVLSVQRRAVGWAGVAFAGVVADFVWCRRAERACERRDLRRAVWASTTCCGRSGLGVCSAL